MECTKAFLPSHVYINFYYYYSYCTLFLNLLISPLQFYIILTKSTNLKGFKWLILNHSCWCLAWELFFALVKPIFFPPAMSGYPLGLLRNGDHRLTAAASMLGFFCAVTMLAALLATVINRYLLAFPTSMTKWFSLKIGIWICVVTCFIGYAMILVIHYPMLIVEKVEMQRMALEYDPCMLMYFHEPGLDFMAFEKLKTGFFMGFVILIVSTITMFLLLIFFIFLIRAHKTKIIAKNQQSLIASSVAQLALSVIFIIVPISTFFGIICFQIHHTENFTCILFCFFVSYSIIESIATLYFVRPYRKAIVKIFQNHFPKNKAVSVLIVSQAVAAAK